MGDFAVEEMLAMQQALQEKYKDKWELIGPEAGKHKLLWMLGEVGEVIDIIKKNGDKTAVEDEAIRQHLVEEMADVLMYYNDVLLCYGISGRELKEAYTAKFEKNMTRWQESAKRTPGQRRWSLWPGVCLSKNYPITTVTSTVSLGAAMGRMRMIRIH